MKTNFMILQAGFISDHPKNINMHDNTLFYYYPISLYTLFFYKNVKFLTLDTDGTECSYFFFGRFKSENVLIKRFSYKKNSVTTLLLKCIFFTAGDLSLHKKNVFPYL